MGVFTRYPRSNSSADRLRRLNIYDNKGLNHAAEIVGGGVDVIDVGFGWSSFCFLMDVEKGGGGSSRGQSRFL